MENRRERVICILLKWEGYLLWGIGGTINNKKTNIIVTVTKDSTKKQTYKGLTCCIKVKKPGLNDDSDLRKREPKIKKRKRWNFQFLLHPTLFP